jgi:hypothetical protein
MTDQTRENSDDSTRQDDADDQQQGVPVAPDVPGADPVRFPSKSGDGASDGVPTEIAEEVEQREYGMGEEPTD